MLAGAVQLNSTEDTERNLATADRLVRSAAARGAELVVLPEKWSVLGRAEQDGRRPRSRWTAECITWARALARELRHRPVAGSIVERSPTAADAPTPACTSAPTARSSARLPQAAHVRRRGRRHALRRVRAGAAG